MATVTKTEYWILPSTETGVQTLSAGETATTDGTSSDLVGYEKIITIYSTGSITCTAQHNPVVGGDDTMWIDIENEEWTQDDITKVYRVSDKIEGDIRVVIVSQESSDDIKVKAKIDIYSITDTYITIPNFRTLSGIGHETVGDEVLCRFIDVAHQDVIRHVGDDAVSTDTFWRTIQEAEMLYVCHLGVIRSWEFAPISSTEVNEISSQWKEQYREIIIKLTGQDPFPDPSNLPTSGGVYTADIDTITPDEDSYSLSTNR